MYSQVIVLVDSTRIAAMQNDCTLLFGLIVPRWINYDGCYIIMTAAFPLVCCQHIST